MIDPIERNYDQKNEATPWRLKSHLDPNYQQRLTELR